MPPYTSRRGYGFSAAILLLLLALLPIPALLEDAALLPTDWQPHFTDLTTEATYGLDTTREQFGEAFGAPVSITEVSGGDTAITAVECYTHPSKDGFLYLFEVNYARDVPSRIACYGGGRGVMHFNGLLIAESGIHWVYDILGYNTSTEPMNRTDPRYNAKYYFLEGEDGMLTLIIPGESRERDGVLRHWYGEDWREGYEDETIYCVEFDHNGAFIAWITLSVV